MRGVPISRCCFLENLMLLLTSETCLIVGCASGEAYKRVFFLGRTIASGHNAFS